MPSRFPTVFYVTHTQTHCKWFVDRWIFNRNHVHIWVETTLEDCCFPCIVLTSLPSVMEFVSCLLLNWNSSLLNLAIVSIPSSWRPSFVRVAKEKPEHSGQVDFLSHCRVCASRSRPAKLQGSRFTNEKVQQRRQLKVLTCSEMAVNDDDDDDDDVWHVQKINKGKQKLAMEVGRKWTEWPLNT